MNRKDIENMPEGREMDALIAGYVMGYDDKFDVKRIPWFSVDIAAAWMVVEKICILTPEDCWTGPKLQINYDNPGHVLLDNAYEVVFDYLDSLDGVHPNYNGAQSTVGKGNSAPLAICRAALLAVMEVEE